ncbi:MAG: acetylornithine deacetylase [Gammaproteobacteria bacterium]|nr:acetylornithine deacetylase [Gammaproteobacteria bacterium]NNJ98393.1 acetylornithine deacetylase [Gammaproteobacteria bacterium]
MTIQTPTLLEMMHQLIAMPSISCTDLTLDQGNRAVIDALAEWSQQLGFNAEIQALNATGSKANLIATIGSGQGGLVLAGHTDTVPFDQGDWRFDPFSLTEVDNRLYGLGTADMKAFFALIIEAIRELDLAQLRQPLIILATADEETSMSGARALQASHLSGARFVLIGEPTGLRPVRMHKGMMMEAIRLTGLSGHSSNPALGHSALEAMHKVMTELLAWRQQLQQTYHNALFEIPQPTLNLGHIHGGDNPNRICGHCELQIDIRPLPGMNLADLKLELGAQLQKVLAGSKIDYQIDALLDGVPALETPANSKLVKTVERLTGSHAEAVAFSTEAPFYDQLGMDAVVLGPGHIAQAHQADEYLEMTKIKPTVQLIQDLVKQFCM